MGKAGQFTGREQSLLAWGSLGMTYCWAVLRHAKNFMGLPVRFLACFAVDGSGSWMDGMTSESSTMLYRSLHNIIERSVNIV